MNESEYYSLIDPNNLTNKIDVKKFPKNKLIDLYTKIKLIREVEIKISQEREKRIIGGPVHLCVGQEAVATGISIHLNKDDYIFGAHRSHAHILSLGSSVKKLFAELLGKKTGLSRGFGGSMHLVDESVGFKGSVPIVAGTISLAVGAGLAITQKDTKNVAISFLGDGATEEGCFHESLNLAKINNLPVIFVVENNQFSSHMEISLRQPSPFVSRFAEANRIPYELIDGNNIIEIADKSEKLIANCRENKGPAFIEAITYRWFGHVDWREDIDVGINRCEKKLAEWKSKCPLKRLIDSLISENILKQKDLNKINEKIAYQIEKDWSEAINANYPEKEELFNNIYN